MPTSRSREIFVDRMAALIEAAESTDLVSTSPVTSARDPARLLRNGLAVVSYSALEDFVVERSFEILSNFDSTKVPFGRLPDKLKDAATVGAAKALSFRVGLEDASSRSTFVQQHAEFIY